MNILTAIQDMISKGRGNGWYKFEKMDCYIRFGPIFVSPGPVTAIHLASLSIPPKFQRKGTFGRLVSLLQEKFPDYPLYLENVMDQNWSDHLVANHNWVKLPKYTEFTPDCLLLSSINHKNF